MKKLKLKRIAKKDTYTIGKLYIDDVYFCDTIEDKDRGLNDKMSVDEILKKKIKGETAIPTGEYKIAMNIVSPLYKSKNYKYTRPYGHKMPRLLNVKGYDGILIHAGNTAKDTYGCILVGENKVVGKVINSQITWKKLMDILVKDPDGMTIAIE